jgi:two-component sensor histidine kinase
MHRILIKSGIRRRIQARPITVISDYCTDHSQYETSSSNLDQAQAGGRDCQRAIAVFMYQTGAGKIMNLTESDFVLQLVETEHRSANTFQLLMSLVRLRLDETDDPAARDQLAWIGDVLLTVSLLQRRLQCHGEPNFGLCLKDFVKSWQSMLKDQSVRIEADVESIDLSPTISSTLALIVQELVTNSVKHNLGDADRHVQIKFKREGLIAELTVSDNGPGLSQEALKSQGLGLKIMRKLSTAIGAHMDIGNGFPGTVACIRLPLVEAN